MHYKPTGVCSQNIEFDIEDNKVKKMYTLSEDVTAIFRELRAL